MNTYKVLVIRTDNIGDVVLSLPVVTELKRVVPHIHVTMLVKPALGPVAELCPDIDDIIFDTDPGMDRTGLKLSARLRKDGFNAALLLHPSFRLAAAIFFAGIPVRAGTGYRLYSFLLNKKVFEHRKKSGRHEAELNLSLARSIFPAVDTASKDCGLKPGSALVQRAAGILRSRGIDTQRPFVAVHPGSRGSALTWPAGSFKELVRVLACRHNVQVIVTGTGPEEDLVRQVAVDHTNVFAVPGLFTLQELAAVLTLAALVIANSTGPLHIAAAVGTPVLGLYPPVTAMSASRWGPVSENSAVCVPETERECEKCRGEECSLWNCMTLISVQEAASKAMELLRVKGQKP